MNTAQPPRQSLRQGLGLALLDLWHDRRTTLVLVLTVAAIVAPLLLLFGLKHGVVTTLRQGLLNDPRNLEIVVAGAQNLPADWFAATARRPDMRFLLPRTRSINTTLDLLDTSRITHDAIDLIPTATGDPLLPPGLPVPAHADEILITERLAERMGLTGSTTAGAGTAKAAPGIASPRLTGLVRRSRNGLPEHAEFPLRVIGVIPERVFAREAVFTHLDLLITAEDYRDGERDVIAAADLAKPLASNRKHFASARVYAASLEGVGTLAAAMRADGIDVHTQAERISTVLALDRVLGFVFAVIAIIGLGGCALALGGALWVNVDRKRRDMALLRLFGFRNRTVVLLPMVQSAVIATLGLALACLAYLAGAIAFNRVLGTNLADAGYVCRLDAVHLVVAGVAALAVALLASIAAGVRASLVDPATCLREG